MTQDAQASTVTVSFPGAAYQLDAVKRAAYAFMAKATVRIEEANTEIVCLVECLSPSTSLLDLERDFRREVLDQELRLQIEAQTEPIRNAILGLAFSRTGMLNE